jgi:hypothetical protein
MLLSDVRHPNRPKNIRIHLAISHVRFYLLRFNSSGNFCDGGASDEKRKLKQEKRCRKATIADTTGLRVHRNGCRCSDAIDEIRPVLRGQTSRVLAGQEPSDLVLSR